MPKVAVMGCGKIVEWHILAYRKLPVEVVVADVFDSAARQMAPQYNLAFFDRPDIALGDPTVSAVDVCVPTVHHDQAILQALAAGTHVFCEKRLFRTLA
jgi:predicted dehydrogenase